MDQLFKDIENETRGCGLPELESKPSSDEKTKLLAANGKQRLNFILKYGWCIPDMSLINQLVEIMRNKTVLSVGSGNAFIEYLLKERGVSIKATDINPRCGEGSKDYMEVEQLDALAAVRKYDTDILLMVWPSSGKMAFDALNEFEGNKFIYIGESRYENNDYRDFYQLLNRDWVAKDLHVPMRQWYGIQDFMLVFERVSPEFRSFKKVILGMVEELGQLTLTDDIIEKHGYITLQGIRARVLNAASTREIADIIELLGMVFY
jgi:hypothetical protein